MVTFATLLRECRLAAGLTQEGLAERSGVSPRSIQQLEAGGARPRRSTITRLVRALALSGRAREELEQAGAPEPRPLSRRRPPTADGAGAWPEPTAVPGAFPAYDGHHPGLVALPRPATHNLPWPIT